MSIHRKIDYKGYGIVPSASWATAKAFTANYSITKPIPTGEDIVHQGCCPGTFASEDDAWEAATRAAKAYIDELPRSRRLGI